MQIYSDSELLLLPVRYMYRRYITQSGGGVDSQVHPKSWIRVRIPRRTTKSYMLRYRQSKTGLAGKLACGTTAPCSFPAASRETNPVCMRECSVRWSSGEPSNKVDPKLLLLVYWMRLCKEL